MAFDVEKEIKILLIAGLIVLLVYGLWLFISYESYYAILGTRPYFDPVTGRIVGGIFLSWAVITIRLIKISDNWEKVEDWIRFTIMTDSLIFIAEIIGIVMYNTLSVGSIIAMIIVLFFVIMGIHIIMQKRK